MLCIYVFQVFKGYETLQIIQTTLDTPIPTNTTTTSSTRNAKTLAKIISKRKGLKFESGKGSLMGFVAYNKEKKDLVVIIRGTNLGREWVQTFDAMGAAWNDTDITGESTAARNLGPEQYSLALYESAKPDMRAYLRANALFGVGVFLFAFLRLASPSSATRSIAEWLAKEKLSILRQILISSLFGVLSSVISWVLISNPILSMLAKAEKKEKVFQSGFSQLYTTSTVRPLAASPQRVIYNAIYDVVVAKKLEVKTITTAGHGLGASLSVIAAHHAALTVKQLAADHGTPTIPITCVTFACPKLGSPEVFKSFKNMGITHYHYLNRGDIVPIVPSGRFTNGLGIDNNHVLRLDPEEVNVVSTDKINKVCSYSTRDPCSHNLLC